MKTTITLNTGINSNRFGGQQGTLPSGTFHGGQQGTLPSGTFHGGQQGTLPSGTFHGGQQGTLPSGTFHSEDEPSTPRDHKEVIRIVTILLKALLEIISP